MGIEMNKAFVRSFLLATILVPIVTIANPSYCAEVDLTIQEIVKKVAPSVVTIEVYDMSGDCVAEGTGFFVGQNLVLTNAHVVDGAFTLRIPHMGIKKASDPQPRLLKSDPEVDLALLEVKGFGSPPLAMATGTDVAPGQQVVVYGNNYEEEHLVSEGIIRACLPEKLIVSASTFSGHSGSPILDMQGRLIGVNRSSLSASGINGMAFGITVPIVEKFMRSPERPQSFPLAGTSLFWPRLWIRISGFFTETFGWIFDAGEWLFSVYLKLAVVWIFGFLTWRMARSIPKAMRALKSPAGSPEKTWVAYFVLAVSVMMLLLAIFAGSLFIAVLLDGVPILDVIIWFILLALLAYFHFRCKALYRRLKPIKAGSENKNASGHPIRVKAGIDLTS